MSDEFHVAAVYFEIDRVNLRSRVVGRHVARISAMRQCRSTPSVGQSHGNYYAGLVVERSCPPGCN